MAVTYVNGLITEGTPNTQQTSLVVNRPTGVLAGDVMIIAVSAGATGTTVPTFPSGWQVLNNNGNSFIAVKTATSSEPSTYTVTVTAAAYMTAGCVVYRGATVVGLVSNLITSTSTPVITAPVAACMIVSGWTTSNSYGGTITAPGGLNNRINNSGDGGVADVAISDLIRPVPGTTSARTATGANTEAFTIAIPPALTSGRRGYGETIKGWRGRGVLTF